MAENAAKWELNVKMLVRNVTITQNNYPEECEPGKKHRELCLGAVGGCSGVKIQTCYKHSTQLLYITTKPLHFYKIQQKTPAWRIRKAVFENSFSFLSPIFQKNLRTNFFLQK